MSERVNLYEGLAEVMPKPEEEATGLPKEFYQVDAPLAKDAAKRLDLLLTYAYLAENPKDLNDEQYRIQLFAKLSFALRKAGEDYSWALYYQKSAYIQRKEAESLAALDNFGGYVAKKKAAGDEIKMTDTMRTKYMSIDKAAIQANRKEAMMTSLVERFATMRAEFHQAIGTIRAMCYGMKDNSQLSSTATGYRPPAK